MMLSRTLRRLVCQLMVGVLLFAQMAVAAYACSVAVGAGVAAMAMQRSMASGDGSPVSHCDQPDSSSKALCAEHCHGGQQRADTVSPPAVQAALPLLLYVLPSQPSARRADPPPLVAARDGAAPIPPPPHAILHCVLRI